MTAPKPWLICTHEEVATPGGRACVDVLLARAAGRTASAVSAARRTTGIARFIEATRSCGGPARRRFRPTCGAGSSASELSGVLAGVEVVAVGRTSAAVAIRGTVSGALADLDVVAPRRPRVELPRATDAHRRVGDHLLP